MTSSKAKKDLTDILGSSGDITFFNEKTVPKGAPVQSLEDVPPLSQGSAPKSFTDALTIQDVEDRKADRALREKFGDKAYKVVRKTLYGWSILLFCYGFSKVFGYEIFPTEVMIAITTAVTLNVYAAFLGVIRGLFPTQKSDKN
ncbi:hypothetical protein [Edwardsiella tarda]